MITMRSVALLAVAFGLTTATGVAQTTTTPAAPPAPRAIRAVRTPNAAFALQMAYRTIGMAEARGASGRYLDAARTHYRAALGKATTAAAASVHEAMAAASLARAALDERPIPTPRDLPAPPALPSPGPRPPRGPRGRFNAEAVAHDAALESTPEANDLARAAVDADIAGERAVFGGDREEGMRQHRIAHDLAGAVRQLAQADHPQAFPTQMRRPMMLPPGMPGRPGGGPQTFRRVGFDEDADLDEGT